MLTICASLVLVKLAPMLRVSVPPPPSSSFVVLGTHDRVVTGAADEIVAPEPPVIVAPLVDLLTMIESPLAAAFNVSVPVVLSVKVTVAALLASDPSVAVIVN